MINKQYSKCPVCGSEEKYVVWINTGGDVKENRCCAKQCMVDDSKRRKK